MIKTVSYSRIADFEECPYRAKLKYIDRIPEPERALRPGQTEHANDRGSRIHLAAEEFVKGAGPLTKEIAAFEEELLAAQALYSEGRVSLEQEWGFTRFWEPCEWTSPEICLKAKLDLYAQLDTSYGLVVDHKTGKKLGNEVKHQDQGKLYAISAFAKYPYLEAVTVEIWYLDQDDIMSTNYERKHAYALQPKLQERMDKVLQATVFPKRANKFTCRWCPYAWFNNGPCESGVKT